MDLSVKKNCGLIAFLALCAFFLLAPIASASTGVFSSSDGVDGPLEFELEGGVKVVFKEIKQIEADYKKLIAVVVTFVSPEDRIIKVSPDGCVAFDDRGNRFEVNFYNKVPAIWIGNERTTERMIIQDVPTDVTFAFLNREVPLAKSFARIDLNLMGTMVTLRNAPSTK